MQHSDDPFKSEYAYSVRAVLRSARDAVKWLQAVIREAPAMCARIHYIWSIAMAVTVCCTSDHSPIIH
jgi:hypothetical protein